MRSCERPWPISAPSPPMAEASHPARSVELSPWSGPWSEDDPDANFKADVALYAHLDPMTTIANLAQAIDVPEGAIVWYVLAKWATAGSGGLLEPVHR